VNIAVRYLSRSGRTKKIADAIAKEANVKAYEISEPLTADVDVLFLGCGLYGKVSSKINQFLVSTDVKVDKVVTFSTAALVDDLHPKLKKIIEKHNFSVDDQHFHCPGVLALKHQGRPNSNDIQNAKMFAKNYLNHKDQLIKVNR
jgi:flavodoxin